MIIVSWVSHVGLVIHYHGCFQIIWPSLLPFFEIHFEFSRVGIVRDKSNWKITLAQL